MVKDLINSAILLSIIFIYFISVNSKEQLKKALISLVDYVIGLSALLAIVWIFDFFQIYLPGNDGIRIFDYEIIDYNFATIPALLGIVSILLILPEPITKIRLYTHTSLLLLLNFQLFLSTSRRSFIIAVTILIAVFLIYFISFFVRKGWISNFARRITPFLLIFVAIILSGYIFVKQTTYNYKIAHFQRLGIVNGIALTNEITEKCLRFVNLFAPEKTISELFEEIWAPVLDSKDPDSGWGKRIHKTIFPLSGKNSDIIPAGVKGYLMDKTCDSYIIEGVPHSYTNVDMRKNYVLDNDTIRSSIFCFVSEDYDGDEVFMILSNKDDRWIGYTSYNLENKGIWQELVIQMAVSAGRVSTYIYFKKKEATNFSGMKGHVIFANPQFKNITQSKKDSVEGNGNTSMPLESSGGGHENLIELSSINPISSLPLILRSRHGDPIRNMINKLFPGDTLYRPYKANLQIDSISYKHGDERILRWKLSWQMFRLEYNWTERIFGGGFSFLNWFGYYFTKDKTEVDWPHNPFMSILLYSGLFGILIYLIFIYKVFYYYIKYLKEYRLLFIFFLITFFFSFFSSGSPFDPPVFGFFSLLPFLVHSIHKNDENNSLITIDEKQS